MTWRPLPGSVPDPSSQPRRVGESLERLTRAMGAPGAGALATLFRHWSDVVGPSVAAHTRPLTLRDRVLTIAADDPAWAMQLSYLEADLRRQVEEALGPGTVERVVVRVR